MKLSDFMWSELVPVLMVIAVLVIVLMFLVIITNGGQFVVTLETPVRDMKIGQVIGLIVLAWFLFK